MLTIKLTFKISIRDALATSQEHACQTMVTALHLSIPMAHRHAPHVQDIFVGYTGILGRGPTQGSREI